MTVANKKQTQRKLRHQLLQMLIEVHKDIPSSKATVNAIEGMYEVYSEHTSHPVMKIETRWKHRAKTINVFRACLGAQLTICAQK